jgi:hypothetical protein
MICDKCLADIAPLKTILFESEELHFAKCVFGTLRRVEVEEALNNLLYKEDLEFIELYVE